jgi:hypothetical protein
LALTNLPSLLLIGWGLLASNRRIDDSNRRIDDANRRIDDLRTDMNRSVDVLRADIRLIIDKLDSLDTRLMRLEGGT